MKSWKISHQVLMNQSQELTGELLLVCGMVSVTTGCVMCVGSVRAGSRSPDSLTKCHSVATEIRHLLLTRNLHFAWPSSCLGFEALFLQWHKFLERKITFQINWFYQLLFQSLTAHSWPHSGRCDKFLSLGTKPKHVDISCDAELFYFKDCCTGFCHASRFSIFAIRTKCCCE